MDGRVSGDVQVLMCCDINKPPGTQKGLESITLYRF